MFYCNEIDKHVIRRLILTSAEKDLVLWGFKKNNAPLDGDPTSIKSSEAVIKWPLTKNASDTTISVNNVSLNRSKKAFDDVL
jgi:hypothetical protein